MTLIIKHFLIGVAKRESVPSHGPLSETFSQSLPDLNAISMMQRPQFRNILSEFDQVKSPSFHSVEDYERNSQNLG